LRLIKLKLNNFRRFAGEHSLDLNEDLIALVGPNEAGKTSVLAALDLVGRQKMPAESDSTRGAGGRAMLDALFVLDPEDREAMTDINEGTLVTHAWMTLTAGAEAALWRLDPVPARDLAPRQSCHELLERLRDDPGLDPEYSIEEARAWDPDLYAMVVENLASPDETLPEAVLLNLEVLAGRLRSIQYPAPESETENEVAPLGENVAAAKQREAAAATLVALATTERQPAPHLQAISVLSGRTPDVAVFGGEDRELQSNYKLAEVAVQTPPALANLCALAEIDLGTVSAEISGGSLPHVEAMFEAGNEKLKSRFQDTWHQSNIYPRLTPPHDGLLRIMLATQGGDNYSFLEERSDGLRWFMALHSFLVARGKVEPILLVDEAETHLHYDAQADLVDALMEQRVARQVIYTTHSVGCLPPDLGCGIRVILADGASERSRIANSYWSVDPKDDQKVGYTPLLFAMGARMLSLTVPRSGVLTEGPADAVLLPTLFREATKLDRLPYRIVPGLSDVSTRKVAALSQHAGKVVYLTDGDDGGEDIRRTLREGGIPVKSIFDLGQVRAGCSVEDLLEASVFAHAINRELDTWGIAPYRVDENEVPDTGRWNWLLAQGKATGTGVDRLSKVRVAQRAVDWARSQRSTAAAPSLVNHATSTKMLALHRKLCRELDVPAPT